MRLKTKLLLVLVAVLAAALVVNVVWSGVVSHRRMESELLERGRVVSLQMVQTWNTLAGSGAPEGGEVPREDSAALNCAVIGRSIGQMVTGSSDYVTRFVSVAPRNPEDLADAYEADAIRAFSADPALSELYGIVEVGGRDAFRYIVPMRLGQPCLDCHGGPAGELDATGHPKEGMSLGDVGGAASVVVPMDGFMQAARDNIVRNTAMSVVVLGLSLAAVYFALTRLVTRPLAGLQTAVEKVGSGQLGYSVVPQGSSREMASLAEAFNRMSGELAEAYSDLEGQVAERTAQLVEANEELGRRGRELEEAVGRLREENTYKDEFLAIVSHELRTPLTSILAFSEVLADSEGLDERAATACREIEAQGKALLLMINDVLEMGRLGAGRAQVAREAVDPCDLLGYVESTVAPIARKAEVALAWDIDPHVPVLYADFDELAHVLENLMFNAVKFTPAGGSVNVRASYDDVSDTVSFAVTDTGIGIDERDQERIFERFVQVDSSTSRRFKGTGLGLPLARRYAQMHGGTIDVVSAPGAGSTFTVRIPRAPLPDEEGHDGR